MKRKATTRVEPCLRHSIRSAGGKKIRREKNMARWLVQMSGERADLEEFPRWFPDGDVYAIEENEAFFLVGPAFEDLPDAEAVLGEAVRTLDRFTAVISLIWPSLRKPIASHVFRESEGRRDVFVFLSARLSMRAKMHAEVEPVGVPSQKPQTTQAQELLRRATGSPHLELTLSLWADQMRSWPRLYRIMEEIEQHLGKHVDAAGLCTAAQRERFTRTANTAEASGLGARHATGKFVAPNNPMSLPEATEFLSQILLSVLR
jgi:hypothetical protein